MHVIRLRLYNVSAVLAGFFSLLISGGTVAADNVIAIPSVITVESGSTYYIDVEGSLDIAPMSTVRFNIEFTPTMVIPESATGSGTMLFQCLATNFAAPIIQNETLATTWIECTNVNPGNGVICRLQVNIPYGPTTKGHLTITGVMVNGVLLTDAKITGGQLERLDKGVRNDSPVDGLMRVYPNPMSDATKIEFFIKEGGKATVAVYNDKLQMFGAYDLLNLKPGLNAYEFRPSAWDIANGLYVIVLTTPSASYQRTFLVFR